MSICIIFYRARWYLYVNIPEKWKTTFFQIIRHANIISVNTYMLFALNLLTKRLFENNEDFLPSPTSFCDTSIFFLSWLFFSVFNFFSMASRFSLIDLCSRILSSGSATISSASFDNNICIWSVWFRGSVEEPDWSIDCCWNSDIES